MAALQNVSSGVFFILLYLSGSHEILTAQYDTTRWTSQSDSAHPRTSGGGASSPQATAPQFFSPSLKLTAQRGDRILLPCVVRNLGDDQILWRHGANIIAGSNFSSYSDDFGRIRLFANFSLEIVNVTGNDEGTYECFLASPIYSMKVQHVVVIQDPPTVSVLPARGTLTVNESDSIQIGCIPHGNPKPRIKWKKQDGQLPENLNVQFNQSLIKMERVSRKHTGLYSCEADNGVGKPAIGGVYVRVLHTPEIETPKVKVHGGVGYKSQLTCIVHADPIPEMHWYLGQTQIVPSDRITPFRRGSKVHTLTIAEVRAEDFGTYSCTANNSLGSDTAHIELTGVPNSPVMTRWEVVPSSEVAKAASPEPRPGNDPIHYRHPIVNAPRQRLPVDGAAVAGDISVQLLWAVECYSRLIDYRLAFRPAPENPLVLNEADGTWVRATASRDRDVLAEEEESSENEDDLQAPWTELTIPADPATGFLHTKAFTLEGLQKNRIYEAVVKARNRYGWSPSSGVCLFSTFPYSSSNHTSIKQFLLTLESLQGAQLGEDFFTGSVFHAQETLKNSSTADGASSISSANFRFGFSANFFSIVAIAISLNILGLRLPW